MVAPTDHMSSRAAPQIAFNDVVTGLGADTRWPRGWRSYRSTLASVARRRTEGCSRSLRRSNTSFRRRVCTRRSTPQAPSGGEGNGVPRVAVVDGDVGGRSPPPVQLSHHHRVRRAPPPRWRATSTRSSRRARATPIRSTRRSHWSTPSTRDSDSVPKMRWSKRSCRQTLVTTTFRRSAGSAPMADRS